MPRRRLIWNSASAYGRGITGLRDAGTMQLRGYGPIDPAAAASFLLLALLGYSAWLTSIAFCAANGMRPLLIAGAVFAPIGIVHGIGIWFGGW